MKDMYNSLQQDISTTSLTQIIYYTIKILNKHRSDESSGIDIKELPDGPKGPNLEIAEHLLKEIDVKSIKHQDSKIDFHINNLYQILNKKLTAENVHKKMGGKEILEKFRQSSSK